MSKERNRRKRRVEDICTRESIIPESCTPVDNNSRRGRGDKCDPVDRDPCKIDLGNFRLPLIPPLPPAPAVSPVFVGNDEVTVLCDLNIFDGGDPVTIAANEFFALTKEEANDLAEAAAEGALLCFYYSEEVTETCPDDVDGVPAELNANNPVTVPAESFISFISKQEATNQAKIFAQSQLDCYWLNGEVTETCPDDVNEVPAELNDNNPFTVAAGDIKSYTSKADADLQAQSQALSQLNCYWLNDEVIETCPDDVDGVPAELNENNPVTIQAGDVISFISKEDANDQAKARALSLLSCYWLNDLQDDFKCPAPTVSVSSLIVSDGNVIVDPSYTYPSVAAGTVTSFTSKADANNQAAAIAASLVTCALPSIFSAGSQPVTPMDPDGECFPFKLSGTYTLDEEGDPDPNSIKYSVCPGKYKRKGQTTSPSDGYLFTGIGPEDYIINRPHFYLRIPATSVSYNAKSSPEATIVQSVSLMPVPTAKKESGEDFVYVYIGSFTGYRSDLTIQVNQAQSNNIEYEIDAGTSFPFQVVQTGPGEVKVRYGTVNSVAPAQVNADLELATAFGSSPTALWLAVSLDSTTQEVTSVTVQVSEPGANSPTSAKIRLATISWNDGVANIGQNISGSQQLVSCGSNHYWGLV